MNQLPPLPLIDGAMFIDNSFLESLTICPRACQYSRLNRRISAADAPGLNFGSAIHLALEYRYRVAKDEIPTNELESQQANLLAQYFEEHPQPVDDWRNLNWAVETIKRYNQRNNYEDFTLFKYDTPRKCDKCEGKGTVGASMPLTQDQQLDSCIWCSDTGLNDVMVELSFALPLFSYHRAWPSPDKTNILPEVIPIIYTGRIDLPIDRDGQIFLLDHKTTSMLGGNFFDSFKKSAQFRGYCWSFEQLTGRTVAGYEINAIRTKEPPQYVKDPSTRENRIADWWQESLCREKFYIKPGDTEEWKRQTIAKIEWFFWMYQRGEMTQFHNNCVSRYGKCAYFDVCDLAEGDRGLYLESGLFQDNNWTPLKSPTSPQQIQ